MSNPLSKAERRTVTARLVGLQEELTDSTCRKFSAARLAVSDEIQRNEELLVNGWAA